MKETQRAVRKEILLFVVSFISCPVNIKGLSCTKAAGGVKTFLISKCFFYPCFFYPSSAVLRKYKTKQFDCI